MTILLNEILDLFCLKLAAFFPPLGILAEQHALQIEMANEDMFTNDDIMSATSWESLQFKAAVTYTRKAYESQINQTDLLFPASGLYRI